MNDEQALQRRALVLAFSAVMLWSTVATAFKVSLSFLSTVELMLYATLFSIGVLTVILIQQGKFRMVFQCTARQYLLSVVLGCLSPFLYYIVLFEAYDRLPAQQAQPINYTWAIMLSVLSVPFLKRSITGQQWIALVVSYLGVLVISTEGDPLALEFSDGFGVFLALLSTVIWSFYWIVSTRDSREPLVGLFLNFIFGFPMICVYYLLTEEVRWIPWQGLAGAAYIGIFEMGISFVLWMLAMKYTNNTARISNLIFLSPFLSLVFIYFIVGEQIVPATFAGLSLIVLGLILQRYPSKATLARWRRVSS